MMRGSIVKRGARWSVVYDEPPGPDGRRKQRWKGGFASRKDAQRWLNDTLARMDRGEYVRPGRKTVGAWLTDDWLPMVRRTRRPNTAVTYTTYAAAYVIPALGRVPLQELSAARLDRFYTDLLERGSHRGKPLQPSTVRRISSVVHAALDAAVRKGEVARNVADATEHLPSVRRERPVWFAEELRAFLEVAASDRLEALWTVLCTTGMRRSEACGLPWTAVDLDDGWLSVTQVLVRVGDTPTLIRGTKTTSSRRSIELDPATVAALKAHRARQLQERLAWGGAWTDTGLVFTREDGTKLNPERLSDAFLKLVARAGLPRITLHGLRHSYASTAIAAGVPIQVVSRRLGHAGIGTTVDLYGHISRRQDREAANLAAEAILGV
jgi:integrase